MNDRYTFEQGDLVVCLTDQYGNIPHLTIGVVTSVPNAFALINCMFNEVRGSFPTHQIMHLDVWQYHEDREKVCK
jgi:hypothetical protein